MPETLEACFHQALTLQRAGRLEEAEELYRRAVPWRPDWALGNLGIILRITGRLEEAEETLRRVVTMYPDNLPARHTLGMTLLQAGKYAEGWTHYDTQRHIYPPAHALPPFPEWRGENLKGKRLLVVAEQGYGDQILLSRFLPALAGMASRVQVASTRALVRLLGGLGVEANHPSPDWAGLSADCWTFMGTVPRWLEAGPADAADPYLPGLPTASPKGVGLMLEGDARNANNANRLPSPPVARAIRGLADFVDLRPEATGAKDFKDTADIISGLQLVVTVDTSVAHLAGALGKPVWIMLCRPAIDWYTRWSDDTTPWYRSARLFRQRAPGDWAGVIRDLSENLSEALSGVAPGPKGPLLTKS